MFVASVALAGPMRSRQWNQRKLVRTSGPKVAKRKSAQTSGPSARSWACVCGQPVSAIGTQATGRTTALMRAGE
jgi:hypothetical protein